MTDKPLEYEDILKMDLNPETVAFAYDEMEARLMDEMDLKEKIEARSVGLVKLNLSAMAGMAVLALKEENGALLQFGVPSILFSVASIFCVISLWGHKYPLLGGQIKWFRKDGFLSGDLTRLKALVLESTNRSAEHARRTNNLRHSFNRWSIVSTSLAIAIFAGYTINSLV